MSDEWGPVSAAPYGGRCNRLSSTAIDSIWVGYRSKTNCQVLRQFWGKESSGRRGRRGAIGSPRASFKSSRKRRLRLRRRLHGSCLQCTGSLRTNWHCSSSLCSETRTRYSSLCIWPSIFWTHRRLSCREDRALCFCWPLCTWTVRFELPFCAGSRCKLC